MAELPPRGGSQFMDRALELARRGQGSVEPNPMVGCVIARGDHIVGEGWHRRFGGPHAEREALSAAGPAARGATMFVTLEPCCHHGKTPPCTDAIIQAGLAHVVVAERDPFAEVSGAGVQQLREAGIQVEVGTGEEAAQQLNAPYHKLLRQERPWVIAKWAMSLDGKLAARSGSSKWISNATSRRLVHEIRGRVDAILIGRQTAVMDNPQLTARPPGPRTATRIVLDSRASLDESNHLVQTAGTVPTLIVAGAKAPPERCRQLTRLGCEVLQLEAASRSEQLSMLLGELGKRRHTNLLIEGGAEVLGAAFDAGEVDEVHVFLAPNVIGGARAVSPVAGIGVQRIADACHLASLSCRELDGDVYLHGRIAGRA